MPDRLPDRPRFVVLVGLPGAGKSTVGPLLAAHLGWMFVDLDDEIEREAGRTVAAIFDAEGESGFRARERAATRQAAHNAPCVIAAGGGWMVDPANREALGDGLLTVYLRVDPAVALIRLAGQVSARPLLRTADPEATLKEILARREAVYLQANHTLAVDSMSPGEVAYTIEALASGPNGD